MILLYKRNCYKLILLFLFLLFISTACTVPGQEEVKNQDTMSATIVGNNTAEAFEATQFTKTYTAEDGYLYINGTRETGIPRYWISLKIKSGAKTGTFTITGGQFDNVSARHFGFQTGADYLASSGSITITELNTEKVKGTFVFKAYTSDNQRSVNINGGKFEVYF